MRTVLLFPRGSGSYRPWHWQSPPLPSHVSNRKWLSKWTSFWKTGCFPLPSIWWTIVVPDGESTSQSFSLFHVSFSLLNSSCELHNTVILVYKWICLTRLPRPPWAAEHFLPSAQSHARSLLLGGISEDVPAEQVQRLLQVRAVTVSETITLGLLWKCLLQRITAASSHSRGNGQQWGPCIIDVNQKYCDIYQPSFWLTIHTLRVIETNSLDSKTTIVRFKLHELRKNSFPKWNC